MSSLEGLCAALEAKKLPHMERLALIAIADAAGYCEDASYWHTDYFWLAEFLNEPVEVAVATIKSLAEKNYIYAAKDPDGVEAFRFRAEDRT